MILSDISLKKLLESKQLIVEPLLEGGDIQCNHIDLHLDNVLTKYKNTVLDLKHKEKISTEKIIIGEEGYALTAGEFCIGATFETIQIPNGYFGFIQTKGNIARAGISAHNSDGHIDPGFKGKVTLEIKNNSNHDIIIYPGISFVRLHLFQATSESANPYNGRYQDQAEGTIYIKD